MRSDGREGGEAHSGFVGTAGWSRQERALPKCELARGQGCEESSRKFEADVCGHGSFLSPAHMEMLTQRY